MSRTLLLLTAPPPEKETIRSFFIVIYDADGEKVTFYHVPVSVVAPFANRLFREMLDLPQWATTLHEPWYSIGHRLDREFVRSPLPEGPTSLYGQRYVPDDESGPAITLRAEALVRYFVVRLFDYNRKLFEGVYNVDDIFLHISQVCFHQSVRSGAMIPDHGPYTYEIVPSTNTVRTISYNLLPDKAYDVPGVFRLPPRVKDAPRIAFKRVPAPPPPVQDPATLGEVQMHGQGEPQAGRVFIPARLYDELRHNLDLSMHNEEGGYALGNVYRQPGSPENEDDPAFRWWIEVTDLLMAEDTIGTPVSLLFTGDTWSKVSKRHARDYADRELVGWFHTHVFPASDSFGLSGLDQNMHAWYLPRPWQTAILLNLEDDGTRTVRCYQRGPEGELVETPFAVFERET